MRVNLGVAFFALWALLFLLMAWTRPLRRVYNEVSESETKSLTKKGHNPGDDEWEALVKRSAGQSANWRKIIRIGMCIASTAVRNGIRLQGA